jgi:CDGSH-type Zn-finger protein
MVTIRLRRNGPYVVEGDDVRVIDADGVECAGERLPVALCRCGASARKPYCDGSHARVGFRDGGARRRDGEAGDPPPNL